LTLFSEFPFIKLLLPFICGIAFRAQSSLHNIIPLFSIVAILLLLEKVKPSVRWKYRKRIGILFQMYLFFLGFNCNSFQTKKHFDTQLDREYIIHLIHLDNSGEKYNRYVSEIYVANDTHKIQRHKAYSYISASLKQIKMGDVILTNNKPKPIRKIYNPGSFNFASFANQNDIYYSLFLNSNDEWTKLTYQENKYLSTMIEIRKWIIKTLKSQLNNPLEAGLTEALLIGYKEDLDDQLQEKYTLTGVSHIIAVSGMHLGLIFSVMASLFNLVSRRKTARYLGFGIILPLLWIFALISGASASVLRSVLVFSFVLFGSVLLKKSGSINALFASAFILLIIKPSFISDIGFQLSYAAVLSILIYEPLIAKWLYIKNKLLKIIWSMVAITLAAQLLTTPIVLYHFKQFPVLFLITNMVAVPLSNIVLLLAILLCFFKMLFLPTQQIAYIIHFCIQLMNSYIEKVANIPFNSIQIEITLPFTICIYGTIAVLTYYFRNPKKTSPMLIVASGLLLSLMYQIDQYQLKTIKRIIVLHRKNTTGIVHQHGQKGVLVASTKLIKNKSLIQQQLRFLSKDLGITEWKLSNLKDQSLLIHLNKSSKDRRAILLSGFEQSIPFLEQLIPKEDMSIQFIADGSNKLWKIKQWEKDAQEVHLRLHSTPEKGAFLIPCDHR
jgi:competence protein ComEC